jgi:hypothetical protein
MQDDALPTDHHGRQLVARISTRLMDQYGAAALDEALSVVTMLIDLGREELVPIWLKAAIEIGRLQSGQQGRAA